MSDRRYFTPKTLAQLWGCCAETIIGHIKAGRLRAFSLSAPGCRKPRFRIAHDAIAEFENRQSAIPPAKQSTSKRRGEKSADFVKYF